LGILPKVTAEGEPELKEELVELVAPNIPRALKVLLNVDRLRILMAIYNNNGEPMTLTG
jgi:hypothetical protein